MTQSRFCTLLPMTFSALDLQIWNNDPCLSCHKGFWRHNEMYMEALWGMIVVIENPLLTLYINNINNYN